jgi:alginate O-acetyltransferase complex protein AlgI
MVFSSHIFLAYFLPVVLFLNYVLPFRWLTLMLTVVSYVFYGWANPPWVVLMLITSYVDYFCGLALVKFSGLPMDGADLPLLAKRGPRNLGQKVALAVSIFTNLAILSFFKYYDFAAESLNAIAGGVGVSAQMLPLLHVALPIGVSFYTFESMSYAIDVYRGDARPLRNPVDYQCFVALFPHLIAGPIIRYHTIAEQIRHRTFQYEKFARGAAFFCLGMAKKILLANPMGHVADRVFAAAGLGFLDTWYGLFAYAFQIYFDFSAYSDMAVGLGLMFGFCLMKNFDDPYRSESITELWRRWHISLSTWLRDYLYIPLGGNRLGESRTYLNLLTVMLLGGLWHGASWNFVFWGLYHGALLSMERRLGLRGFFDLSPRPIRVAGTFLLICVGWVFFRAETLPQAVQILRSLIGLEPTSAAASLAAAGIHTPYHLFVFAICGLIVWGAPQTWNYTQRLTPARAALCLSAFVTSVMLLWTQTVNPFLYFQF